MIPKKSNSKSCQTDLFKLELKQIINLKHPMVKLADSMDWNRFDEVFGKTYCFNNGRPGKATRLMVSLNYLKGLQNLSDEETLFLWVENPYWQYFSGMKFFQHEFPIDSSTMTKWRKRIGGEGMEELLAETISTGLRIGALKRNELKRVNIDTTVQEKAIRFPTDSRLCDRARERLVKLTKEERIELRQNYNKVSKFFLLMQSRYARARQMKRAKKCTKKIKNCLGRVIRDIERKCTKFSIKPSDNLKRTLEIAKKVYEQKKDTKNKIYSIHETEVACISKGKPHKKYEFGNKIGIATTTKNNWIVASKSFKGGPYDGNTTLETMKQLAKIVGAGEKIEIKLENGEIITKTKIIEKNRKLIPKEAFVDNGYKGIQCKQVEEKFGTIVHVDRKRRGKIPKRIWKKMKQRARIEPIIGHLKNRYGMGRNLLKGTNGDEVNALLSASAMNLRKLLKFIELFLFQIFRRLFLNFFERFFRFVF